MPENANAGDAVKPPGTRLATSEDIPRAVEFLINFVMRWTLFFFFGLFGLLALAAWLRSWAWWVLVPAMALSLGSFCLAWSFKPRGKFVVDQHGPMVMVPGSKSVDDNRRSSS